MYCRKIALENRKHQHDAVDVNTTFGESIKYLCVYTRNHT